MLRNSLTADQTACDSFDEGVSYGLTLAHRENGKREAKEKRTHLLHLLVDLALLLATALLIMHFGLKFSLTVMPFIVLGATVNYLLQRLWKRDFSIH